MERKEPEKVLDNIEGILLNGAKLILDKVFDSVGFNRVGDDVLRHLVIARLCEPMSKMATADYLKTHFAEDVGLQQDIPLYGQALQYPKRRLCSVSAWSIRFRYWVEELRCCFTASHHYTLKVFGKTNFAHGILQGWQDSRDPDYPRTSCLWERLSSFIFNIQWSAIWKLYHDSRNRWFQATVRAWWLYCSCRFRLHDKTEYRTAAIRRVPVHSRWKNKESGKGCRAMDTVTGVF